LEPMLPLDSAEVFFDGIFSEPRLRHPEGIAIDADGDIWCGGETGEIYRISADGSGIETVASTEGFILGLAFDDDQNLYPRDMRHSAVFRLDTGTGRLVHFANGGGGNEMRIPNFPVIDSSRNYLYVSDSYDPNEKGPGVWRFDLESGEGGLWYDRAMIFANGMALSPDKDYLYIACYEPSRKYRVSTEREIHLLIDPMAHPVPSNELSFRGEELFTSNLGRWHITRIEARSEGLALP
jgi:gluconolactonase